MSRGYALNRCLSTRFGDAIRGGVTHAPRAPPDCRCRIHVHADSAAAAMPHFASSTALRRVATAQKKLIDGWKEGRHLERESSHTLEELLARVAADRIGLARSLLRDAERLAAQHPPLFRASVSRGYYAMYHAMRAAAFVFHGGDDHQEHKALPTKAPADMPEPDKWSNKLKDARERRNQADYDPYPKSELAWRGFASAILPDAKALIVEVRTYLRTKGIPNV